MRVGSSRFRWALLPGILCLLFAALVIADGTAPGGRGIVKIQGIDPTCYFGTAHSVLFDRDFNLSNELRVFPPSDGNWTARQPGSGLPSSPFAIGYSLLTIPFLAIGTMLDALAGNSAGGYSRFALLLYFFANVAFSITGLFVLVELLFQIFGEALLGREWRIYLSAGATFLGTSLLVYSFSPMAHAATFLCVCAFLLAWHKFKDSYSYGGWALLGLVAGILGITRWQDSLFVAGPVLFDVFRWRSRVRCMVPWVLSRGIYILSFTVCWIPQMLEWKAIYGKYLTVPQGDGFLQWPPVHFFQVLFSTSHGWFVWTPVALIGVAGLIAGMRESWTRYLPWLMVILMEVTVSGANTTNWDGSDSFSIRSLTSCLPLIAIGLGVLVSARGPLLRRLSQTLIVVCTGYALLFALQFRLDMIPRKDRLTAGELFRDKIFFREAYARRGAHREAVRLMLEGRPKQAQAVAETAIEGHREDRFLLADMEQSSREAGDSTEAALAHERLERLLRRRLF